MWEIKETGRDEPEECKYDKQERIKQGLTLTGIGIFAAGFVWSVAGLSNMYSQYRAAGAIIDPADCFWRTEIVETALL